MEWKYNFYITHFSGPQQRLNLIQKEDTDDPSLYAPGADFVFVILAVWSVLCRHWFWQSLTHFAVSLQYERHNQLSAAQHDDESQFTELCAHWDNSPTNQLAVSQATDWSACILDNSWTSQLAHTWSDHSNFVSNILASWLAHKTSSPRVVQSTS